MSSVEPSAMTRLPKTAMAAALGREGSIVCTLALMIIRAGDDELAGGCDWALLTIGIVKTSRQKRGNSFLIKTFTRFQGRFVAAAIERCLKLGLSRVGTGV
jgi:hypothetical protein